jgi:hypothetical protein
MAMERENTSTNQNPVLAVFKTTELCEHILLNLNIYELSRAKSVCRRFSEVINGSLPLQQILFLSPRSSKIIYAILTTEPSRKLLIGSKTADHSGTAHHHASGDPTSGVIIYEKYPALQVESWSNNENLLARAIGAYAFKMHMSSGMSTAVDPIVVFSSMAHDSVLHKTYISQPPVKYILGNVGNYCHESLDVEISDEHGITFGHLHKAMTEFMDLDDKDLGFRNSKNARGLLVSFDGGVPVNAKGQRVLESLDSREVILGKDAQNDRGVAYEGNTDEDAGYNKKPSYSPWWKLFNCQHKY